MRLNDCQEAGAFIDPVVESHDRLIPWPGDLAYAVVLDGPDGEIAITDFMVRRACERVDDEQVSPFENVGQYAPARARVARRAS